MCDIINRFSINCHSSIRCDNGNMVLRFDPFRVEDAQGQRSALDVLPQPEAPE